MKNSSNSKNSQLFETILQLGLIFLIMAFCFKLLAPFVMPILWAIIIAIILYPAFNYLQKKLKGRKTLASVLITVTILCLVIIPAVAFFSAVGSSIIDLKSGIDSGTLKVSAPNETIKEWPVIGKRLYDFLYSLSANLEQGLLEYKQQIMEVSKKVLAGIVSSAAVFLQIILSVIIAGVLLVSTSAKELAVNFIMRVAGDKGDEILNITVSTVSQVVKGIIGVAIIQTIIQAFGLFLCGVPFAGILTLICLILSILQIGPIIVNIGVIIYLFANVDTTPAILWSVFFAFSGLSDNVLKPLLLGKGALVPMLVIFLGVIGGFMMSGFVGLFVGPIVFSVGYKLFMSWLENRTDNVIS